MRIILDCTIAVIQFLKVNRCLAVKQSLNVSSIWVHKAYRWSAQLVEHSSIEVFQFATD